MMAYTTHGRLWGVRRPPVRTAETVPPGPVAPPAPVVQISLDDALPLIALHRAQLPAPLASQASDALAAAWPAWVAQHNAEIHKRLAQGDEDSIVNLWLYGTSFTTRPRATAKDVAALGSRKRAEDLLIDRLDDLVAALAAPVANDRLLFARQVIVGHGIDPATPAGQDQARRYLVEVRERIAAENDRYRRTLASASLLADERARLSAFAEVYRDRGLSSDTSIRADFSLDQSFEAAAKRGQPAPGSIRRIAIVGPGLDFTDKAEGYDFYPLQTIQPFAVIDSLVRLGLARAEELHVTTFDLSSRVNQHLQGARDRAARGEPYEVQLPLEADDPARQWSPDLVRYWETFGGSIGERAEARPLPAGVSDVRVRAVRVRPAVVSAIDPRDVNIVLERIVPPAGQGFDLIIATNVLVYYDAFEQALALTNVSKMLQPGGYFVTNYAIAPIASMERVDDMKTPVFWDRQQNGDTILWYRKRQ